MKTQRSWLMTWVAMGATVIGSVSAYADEVQVNLDENGIAPKYWSTFDDGTKNSVGTGAIAWTGSSWTGDYCLSPGGKALKNTSSWGNFDEKIERPFTLTMSVRLPSYQSDQRWEWEGGDRVMLALGRAGGDVVGIKNKAGFKVAAFYNNSANQTVDLVCDTAVGRSAFVRCALVCKTDNTVEFYVDGELVSTTTWNFELNSAEFQTGGVCGAERDKAYNSYRQAIDDWRVYDVALTAAQIADIAAANRKTDENGIEPIHWYKFDDNRDCTGSYDANCNGEYYPNYENACDGKAISGQIWSDAFAPLSDRFTFVTLARAVNPGENRVIWHCGSGYNKTFGLWANGEQVGIFTGDGSQPCDANWTSNGSARLFAVATVPNADKAYNVYAVTYEEGLFSLYVNGAKVSDSSTDGVNIDPTQLTSQGFQVNGTYLAGVSGISPYGGKVDDFRYYDRVLTEEQLQKINETFFAVDENGMLPIHWYKFDDDLKSAGRAPIGDWDQTPSFVDGIDGKALVVNDSPWYAQCSPLGAEFTFVTAAKTKNAGSDRIIWSRGSAHNYSLGLYANGTTVGIFTRNAGNPDDENWNDTANSRARLLVRAEVPLAAMTYVSYAIVCTNGILSLYVNGELAGDSTGVTVDATVISGGQLQFGQGHGTGIAGLSNGGADIDDFRYYAQALTAEELKNIAETFVDEDIYDEINDVPTHWYKFNGNSKSSGRIDMNCNGGTWGYTAGIDGQALNETSGPWFVGSARLTGAFTFVTAAKTKGGNGIDRLIWARGTNGGKIFGLYANNKLDGSNDTTVGLYANGWSDKSATFCKTVVNGARDDYHVYAVTYDPATQLFTLYVDGVQAAQENASVDPADIDNGNFQFGNASGGFAPNIWECGGDVDDFRLYERVLTEEELATIKKTFVHQFATPDFTCINTVSGGGVSGWFSGWEYHGFSQNFLAIAPGQNQLVYRVFDDGVRRHHPGSTLKTVPARTVALYAAVETMEGLDDGKYHVLAHLGGTTQNDSGAAICLARKGGELMLAYMDGKNVVGTSPAVDVTGLKGYHLIVFSYETDVGTMLTIDGNGTIRDTSDLAKVQPADGGFQIGATWGGVLAEDVTFGNGLAVRDIIGYDIAVGELEMKQLLTNYPANDLVVGDFDLWKGSTDEAVVPTCSFENDKYLGIIDGILTVPAGVEIGVPYLRFCNQSYDTCVATLNLAGKITTTHLPNGCGKDVYNDRTGVLFGHWNGTGTYNITGELDASVSYIEMCYSALDQTMNVDGGLVKAKGIWKGSCSWAQEHADLVTVSNGGRIETTDSVGFDVALEVLGGENTVVFGETSTSAEPIKLTAGSVAFEIDDGKTVTRAGAITGTGTLVKTGTGTLVLTGEAAGSATVRLTEGTLQVPAWFAGRVRSGVKGMSAVPSAVEDGMRTYSLKKAGFLIYLE